MTTYSHSRPVTALLLLAYPAMVAWAFAREMGRVAKQGFAELISREHLDELRGVFSYAIGEPVSAAATAIGSRVRAGVASLGMFGTRHVLARVFALAFLAFLPVFFIYDVATDRSVSAGDHLDGAIDTAREAFAMLLTGLDGLNA